MYIYIYIYIFFFLFIFIYIYIYIYTCVFLIRLLAFYYMSLMLFVQHNFNTCHRFASVLLIVNLHL